MASRVSFTSPLNPRDISYWGKVVLWTGKELKATVLILVVLNPLTPGRDRDKGYNQRSVKTYVSERKNTFRVVWNMSLRVYHMWGMVWRCSRDSKCNTSCRIQNVVIHYITFAFGLCPQPNFEPIVWKIFLIISRVWGCCAAHTFTVAVLKTSGGARREKQSRLHFREKNKLADCRSAIWSLSWESLAPVRKFSHVGRQISMKESRRKITLASPAAPWITLQIYKQLCALVDEMINTQ